MKTGKMICGFAAAICTAAAFANEPGDSGGGTNFVVQAHEWV